MNGIASQLDQTTTEHVESLWQELETKCGLAGIKVTPFPHISWQVTEGYQFQGLEKVLSQISQETRPFYVRTAGLGLFTGENPVIYLSVIKEKSLARFHEILWEQTRAVAIQPAPYYSPELWVPHITLAYDDVHNENLGCALQQLAFRSFDWEILIDNLIVIAQTDEATTQAAFYKFGE